MAIRSLAVTPYDDQKPGTSGLRSKTRIFRERPLYVVQAVLDAVGGAEGVTSVLGGDGRTFMDEALVRTLAVLAGNRAGRVVIGERGLLSIPAVSCLIRRLGAKGDFVLTASHNPGGPGATSASSPMSGTAARRRRRWARRSSAAAAGFPGCWWRTISSPARDVTG